MKCALGLILLASASCAARPVMLTPDLSRSFAHMAGERLCLVSDGWVLDLVFESDPFAAGPGSKAVPSRAHLYRGRDLYHAFDPKGGADPFPARIVPAGTPTAPAVGLEATLVEGRKMDLSHSDSSVTVTLSAFTADGVAYGPIGPLKVSIRGPYP